MIRLGSRTTRVILPEARSSSTKPWKNESWNQTLLSSAFSVIGRTEMETFFMPRASSALRRL